MADNKFHIKHIEIWIILFGIALGCAIFFLSYALTHLGPDYKPGYYEITANDKEDVPLYASEYTFLYYLDGDSNEIKDKKTAVTNVYSDILAAQYAAFDDENIYNNYLSISRINKNPNQEVVVTDEIYETLEDAYYKTLHSDNYSLFADPIYSFWYHSFALANLDLKIERDPINSEVSREYLSTISNLVNDRNEIDLLFLGNHKVKLVVSEHYQSVYDEYEVTSPYIGLNILKSSYTIKYLMEKLEARGYPKGIIVSHDGVISQHGGNSGLDFAFYESEETSIVKVGTTNIGAPSAASNMHRFNVNQLKNSLYYEFTKDGVKYYRSLYIDIDTGLQGNDYIVTQVLNKSVNPVESTYLNNELSIQNDIEGIKNYLNSHELSNEMVLIDFNKNDKSVYVSESLYNYVSLSKELDYNLIKF